MSLPSNAQQRQQRDLTEPIEVLEVELKDIAYQILHHDSLPLKHALNKIFISRMETILQRPDSYDYPFRQMVTVSRIFPADNSFRIFTWTICDRDQAHTYNNSIYFGFVQRKYINPKTKRSTIILTKLKDRADNFENVEKTIMTPDRWLGALYYQPRNSEFGILSYNGKYREYDGLTGKAKVHKIKYYVLLGLNQHNISSNYKIIEVISFDPNDSSKVLFGAPIFVFSGAGVPLMRKVFQYGDNSPFSLNLGYFRAPSLMGLYKKKYKAIIFDHLAVPKHHKKPDLSLDQVGSDGSYDAFLYINRVYDQRKGIFVIVRNVEVYSPAMEKYSKRDLEKQRKRHLQGKSA